MNYTKGPWIKEGHHIVSRTSNGDLRNGEHSIAVIHPNVFDEGCVFTDEAKANANLIACAPELLEALENLLVDADYYREHGLSPSETALNNARAVVLKAKSAI